jgi:predicted dithiol-disulfide oxidoreductase (DUF899 family)
LNHEIVSPENWVAKRKELLKKEKEFTRLGDQLSDEKRKLPWVKVDKEYVFDGPNGRETLADLFGGRSQLIVYHFMLVRNGKKVARPARWLPITWMATSYTSRLGT